MRFFSSLTCLLIATQVMANLTEQDLNSIQESKSQISQAMEGKSNIETQALLVRSKEILNSDKMRNELIELKSQAQEINDQMLAENHNLLRIDNDGQSYIDFEHLESLLGSEARSKAEDALAPFTHSPTPLEQSLKADVSRGTPNQTQSSTLWIFVSSSMSELQLKKAYEMAAEWGGRVMYKGLIPGHDNLNSMIKYVATEQLKLNEIKKKVEQGSSPFTSIPAETKGAIYLNPLPFDSFNIDRVPALVWETNRPTGESFTAKVYGLINPSYLMDKAEQAMLKGNESSLFLGELGTVGKIVERHWIEEVAERTERIDWEKAQEEAVQRHWRIRTYIDLPSTDVDKTFLFDPSKVVARDVKAVDGTVLARSGEKYNPMQHMPMHMTIYVFNPNDTEEMEFVRHLVISESLGEIILMATTLDPERGKEQLKEINNYFKIPMRLLTADVRDRFGIQVTPTKLQTTDYARMRIQEYSRSTVRSTNQFNRIQQSTKSE
jgi:conjugal transfer pilus assembly protein TraW